MAELQAMKNAAQTEMDRQRTDYEQRILDLAKDMVSVMVYLEREGGRERKRDSERGRVSPSL